MSVEPWENWNIDAIFLANLDRWATNNPETSLDQVWRRVCDAIDQGREFFEVIPDGAFPARGIVKALAHLVRFGKTIALANMEVHAFAMEVVAWVTTIQLMFSAGQRRLLKRNFARTTWSNLQQIRRWSLFTAMNKLSVGTAIEIFKKRLSDARAILNETAIINQAHGFDAILDFLGIVTNSQKTIKKMIIDMHATQTDQLNVIVARLDDTEARHIAKERHAYVDKMLSEHAISTPTYVAQGKQPCDDNTRVEVLKDITRWVWDVDPSTAQNFLWLSGDPGCGKSAVTASLVRQSKVEGILWAQYFISRNNIATTNPNTYFPTIARQLSERSVDVERKIHDQLRANDTLLDGLSAEQASGLFINSVRVASRLDTQKPVLIVIDGLDETDAAHLEAIAVILADLFRTLPDCPNVKVFISSRTEHEIHNPFVKNMVGNVHVKHIHLHTGHPSCLQDVAFYLRTRLGHIVQKHELDWTVWPGEERLDMLANNASGLFIWAATAVKFLEEQIMIWGQERLELLLDDLTSKGMAGINALYAFILVATYKGQMKDEQDAEWACETFRRLVGAIVVLYVPLTLDNLSKMLNLRRTMSSSPVDVIQFIRRLRTVLVSGTEIVHGGTIPRFHKSFYDYITSDGVDPRFGIDINASHIELGIRCLHQFPLVHSATASYKMPGLFRYASAFWFRHLSQSLQSPSGIVIADPHLSLQRAEEILQRSLVRPTVTAPISISIQGSSVVATVLGQDCTWDFNNGLVHGDISVHSTVHTKLPSAIYNPRRPMIGLLSPQNKYIIWSAFWHSELGGRQEVSKGVGLWDSVTHTRTTLRKAGSIKISTFNNDHFAYFDSGTIHIQKIQPTRLSDYGAITIPGEIRDSISCLCLSPTGQSIVIGFTDGTLQLWNVYARNSVCIGSRQYWSSPIVTAVFSRNGNKLLSYSKTAMAGPKAGTWDKNIVMWDMTDGAFRQTWVFRGPSEPRSVTFSPDGMIALSGHVHGELCFWDTTNGVMTGSIRSTFFSRAAANLPVSSIQFSSLFLGAPYLPVSSIEFSDDGQSIVSCTSRGHLELWDVGTKRLVASRTEDVQDGITACFLSRGRLCSATHVGMDIVQIKGSYSNLRRGFKHGIVYWEFAYCSRKGVIRTVSTSSNGNICVGSLGSGGTWKQDMNIEVGHAFRAQTFALSLDETCIAAMSSRKEVIVWRLPTGKLCGRGTIADSASTSSPVTSMFFMRDNTLVTVSAKTTSLWSIADGKLNRIIPPMPFSKNPPLFFDLDELDLDNETTYHGARWIPNKHNDSGLWVFIGSHVIRAEKDGTVVITEFNKTI
ncbi:hypothetical protein H0H87_002028 [Tephrocybe sp. NHM501043]|nr:hypothetical protein H0H87_002028 [Tephrocybe sp. NHM501043]